MGFALAAGLWGVLSALAAGRFVPNFLVLAPLNLLGVLLLGLSWGGLRFGDYRQDSLLTLAPFDQAVVAGIAAVMVLLGGWAAYCVARRAAVVFHGPYRCAIALATNLLVTLACYFVLWLFSPQVFYIYYRMIFPDLDQQWVIGGADRVEAFAHALRLEQASSLADMVTGLFFWLLVSLTVSVHAVTWRTARQAS